VSDEPCRIDVWLWRARFFKTRALACRFVEGGKVRVSRAGAQTRLDKASRTVRPGDGLVFAIGGRLFDIRVEGVGERRGPASEARAMYSELNAALSGDLV
jgi:ribosome-associated heat shock protein Hsp15